MYFHSLNLNSFSLFMFNSPHTIQNIIYFTVSNLSFGKIRSRFEQCTSDDYCISSLSFMWSTFYKSFDQNNNNYYYYTAIAEATFCRCCSHTWDWLKRILSKLCLWRNNWCKPCRLPPSLFYSFNLFFFYYYFHFFVIHLNQFLFAAKTLSSQFQNARM